MSFAIHTREPVDAWPEPFAEALSDHEPGTFHVRNAVIGVARDAMFFANILDDEAELEWPHWPPTPFGSERADAILAHLEGGEDIDTPLTEDERDDWKRFEAERERCLAKTCDGSPPDRVPSYKFQSHDGWIVTAHEARLIADAIGELLDDEEELELYFDLHDIEDDAGHTTLLEAWGMFNATAAEYGGYVLG